MNEVAQKQRNEAQTERKFPNRLVRGIRNRMSLKQTKCEI